MKDPSRACWWIHLEPEDYKTGRKYGSYWCPVPNTVFPDKTTFYEYIDRWLDWGRESHGPVKHNYFFRGCSDCDPLNSSDWNARLNYVFDRETSVRVPPKEVRKMFVSYLKDQDASRSELEAAAAAQHHSRKMQDKIYDMQQQLRKLQPILDFNERVVDKVLADFHNGN